MEDPMQSTLDLTRLLRCVVCRSVFDFTTGEVALVLRHVAYGYDFVHDGACLAATREWIFPEPGFDCAAFARDPERRRVLNVAPAEGWLAVSRTTAGQDVRQEPLVCWVLVERRDGTTSMEGLIRGDDWLDEPGGAEFATSVLRVRAASPGDTWLAAA
jgi:hypothetical protein